MFKFFKKIYIKNQKSIEEIKQYVPSQNESISLIRLNEKIEELGSAYYLMENRVKSYISEKNKNYKNDIGVISSINLFREEILTNIKFMTSNNENQVYSELIVQFDDLKIKFENLIDDVNNQR